MHSFTPQATFRTASHFLISLQLQNLLTTTLASLLASLTQPALTVLCSTVWPALLNGFHFDQRAMSQQKCTAVLPWAKCIPHSSELLCKAGSQQACITTMTPMETSCSYRSAVSKQKCAAPLLWASCISHCSLVLLCKTGSQQALCHCNYTYGDLLFIQVCSEPTEMHSSSGWAS